MIKLKQYFQLIRKRIDLGFYMPQIHNQSLNNHSRKNVYPRKKEVLHHLENQFIWELDLFLD
jgi:hypothetical protein